MTFRGQVRTVYKFTTGASHCELYCFEPQTTVGVLTVPFSSQDVRTLESLRAMESCSITHYYMGINDGVCGFAVGFEVRLQGVCRGPYNVSYVMGVDVMHSHISH